MDENIRKKLLPLECIAPGSSNYDISRFIVDNGIHVHNCFNRAAECMPVSTQIYALSGGIVKKQMVQDSRDIFINIYGDNPEIILDQLKRYGVRKKEK